MSRTLRAVAVAALAIAAPAVAMPNAFWIFGIDMPGRHKPWSFSDARIRRDIAQLLRDSDVTVTAETRTADADAPIRPVG